MNNYKFKKKNNSSPPFKGNLNPDLYQGKSCKHCSCLKPALNPAEPCLNFALNPAKSYLSLQSNLALTCIHYKPQIQRKQNITDIWTQWKSNRHNIYNEEQETPRKENKKPLSFL